MTFEEFFLISVVYTFVVVQAAIYSYESNKIKLDKAN